MKTQNWWKLYNSCVIGAKIIVEAVTQSLFLSNAFAFHKEGRQPMLVAAEDERAGTTTSGTGDAACSTCALLLWKF